MAWAVALTLAAVTGGTALMAAAVSDSNVDMAAAALGALGLASLFVLAAFALSLTFLAWLALTPPTPGDNAYGPPPGRLITAL